ncbi:MBL fold metallo-hydrolase [Bulleidia sp. zg-1006]|uniref:MBL fold metallo-hydrolase n=1 Tax=Bulleidia sp. zg-1006 TaxID=2806552 RepID=UPI001939EDA5|nr:MBL fold metallo-hydrolase [Bulleidia sp. zg-1006]QRG86027.1 MBL fold metallo-hydrolase [Bulleidia sp. zg-1006]
MKVIYLNQGKFQENTYICLEDKEALIIDPGNSFLSIQANLQGYKVVGIYLTHGHSDHTVSVDDLMDAYPEVPLFMHEGDRDFIDPKLFIPYGAAIYHSFIAIQEGPLAIGHFQTEVIYTPGHSMGSTCLRIKDCLFSGDTLFKGTVGRSDLYGGDEQVLMQSLKKLKKLNLCLKVYPGHDQVTTLAYELQNNPFLR